MIVCFFQLTSHDENIIFYILVQINFDDECGSNKSNNLLKKDYAALVTFSSKVSYGTDDCTVHITNPWLTNIQYGFGLFIARQLDCSSMLTVDCLTASSSTNEVTHVFFSVLVI